LNKGPWRCFHCDEVFTSVEAAWEHFGEFGEGINAEPPACVHPLRYDELARCRELAAARRNLERAYHQRDETQNDADAYHAMRAELRRLFGSGADTAFQAYLVLDAMEGRAIAAEKRAKRAEEALARHGLTIPEAA
jgi:hypothetical protein